MSRRGILKGSLGATLGAMFGGRSLGTVLAGTNVPAVFVATTAVNLRAKPSSGSRILTVVPQGARVLDYDLVLQNGYRGVNFDGTVGWMYDDFLLQQTG